MSKSRTDHVNRSIDAHSEQFGWPSVSGGQDTFGLKQCTNAQHLRISCHRSRIASLNRQDHSPVVSSCDVRDPAVGQSEILRLSKAYVRKEETVGLNVASASVLTRYHEMSRHQTPKGQILMPAGRSPQRVPGGGTQDLHTQNRVHRLANLQGRFGWRLTKATMNGAMIITVCQAPVLL